MNTIGLAARNAVRNTLGITALACMLSAFTPPAAAQCPDQWFPIFGVSPGTNGNVRAATLWDPDGDGPMPKQPVVAGEFAAAGGIGVGKIARFDGDMWLPFGSGAAAGVGGTVRALTSWDPDGAGPQASLLVAGGEFTFAGGSPINRVAYWDGAGWHSFHMGFAGTGSTRAAAATTWDPDGDGPQTERLIVGGNFTSTPGGTTVNRVAQWDGAAWQPMGSGFASGETIALAVYDPDGPGPQTPRLVAGGNWTLSGSTTVNRVAWWDGAAWQPMGSGFNNSVVGLTAWDPDGAGPQGERVVATGSFLMSGATSTQFVAAFNGTAWQPLGLGVGSSAFCVGSWDPDGGGPLPPEVLVGGSFSWAGGNTINRLARWNGVEWQSFGNNVLNGTVYALTNWDPDGAGPLPDTPLAVGGITTAGTRTVNNVASWQGSDWRQLGHGLYGSTSGAVSALTTWDPDGAGPEFANLVAGGLFSIASGKTVNRIARFDGTEWHPFGTGCNGLVCGLAAWDPDGGGPLAEQLIVVGSFSTAGGITVNNVARWDGTQWLAFGSGIGAQLNAVTVWDTDGPGGNPGVVVVGGNFTEDAGKPGNHVAMWNGSAWQRMSDGFVDGVLSLESFSATGHPADARVYAGGSFGVGGVPPFSAIAQWNGAAWESCSEGVDSNVICMRAVSGPSPTLVVGGVFNIAINATAAHRIGAWSGSAWIQNGLQPGFSGFPCFVQAVTAWDMDGTGPETPQVVAGGVFTGVVSGPEPVLSNIARRDGGAWVSVGSGTNDSGAIQALTSWDPDGPGPNLPVLVVGGVFTTAGGLPGPFISAAGVCVPTCNAMDANCDGMVSDLDVAPFVQLLLGNAGPCSSCGGDVNQDQLIDGDDIDAFVQAVVN